ncbi:MAG TPA: NADH-quinone oxidoreductase subunit N [Gemmatimonadaceae bacterium]|nr:NADH-quinone oxidoreductase subunit N [Gemmatimonadaceae bacterium]
MQLDLSLPMHLTLALTPDVVLFGGAMLLMIFAAWRPESAAHQRRVGVASLVLVVLTAIAVVVFARRGMTASTGVIAVDPFRWAADIIFLLAAAIAIATSLDYNAREGIWYAESHVLILFATGGMMLLAAARDLMIVFLGIELMSIAVYVLAGMNRRSAKSAEGAIKYFLLGAFSTAFLLYGIALVYGATGTTNLVRIGEQVLALRLDQSALFMGGVALMLVGFAFKVAAAPFHMWTPDVYEGAPMPITGYMAAAVKAGAFAALLRVWLEAFPIAYAQWHAAVWWLAALTMIVGNVVALQQRNLKRMLAYSSIAHTGFLLVALATGTAQASTAFLFYLLAYTLATMGAFTVLIALADRGDTKVTLNDIAGLWYTQPGLAVTLTIFMLALLGFPVFGGMGFLGKWYVLQAALQAPAPQTRLAVLLVIMTAVSAGYYLEVVRVMFMRARPEGATEPAKPRGATRVVIYGTAVVLLVFGIFPDPVARLASAGTHVAPEPPVATRSADSTAVR